MDSLFKCSAYERLMGAISSNCGLDNLVELASEIIGNPVYVVDVSNRFISASKQLVNSEVYFSTWLEKGYIDEGERSSARQQVLKGKLAKANSPFFSTRDAHEHSIFAPIKLYGEYIACLCVHCMNRPFTQDDLETAKILVSAITIELQKTQKYHENRGNALSYQLLDAMSGNKESGMLLAHWAGQKFTHVLFAAPSESDVSGMRNYYVLLRSFRDTLRSDAVAMLDNGIIMLINQAERFAPGSLKYELIEELLRINHISAGCSRCVDMARGLDCYYREARFAQRIGNSISTPKIISYDEVYLYHMLDIVSREKDLEDFYDPAYLTLMRHDRQKCTQYLDTLHTYLLLNRDAQATSRTMSLHTNTLFYRLNRIKEIIGCDFGDMNSMLGLLLSFRIHDFIKKGLNVDTKK